MATEPENQAPEAVVEPVTGQQPVDTVYLTQAEGPDGDTLTLVGPRFLDPLTINDADQARANFVVPELEVSQTAVFQVTVSDGELTSTAQAEVQLQGATQHQMQVQTVHYAAKWSSGDFERFKQW